VKSKNTKLLNRREFSGLCVALSSFVILPGASGVDAATDVASTGAGRTVRFRDGTVVPALGQGSAGLGKGRHPQPDEEEALRTGLSLGLTLIDTAEIYGSEKFIGRAIAGQRNRVFLVSKVWPNHVAGNGIARACEASLARLGTDHLDLYLLHWPNGVTDFSHVVKAFEDLHAAGKIRAWGVSNFNVRDMIAGRLGVSVGYLQVTSLRLGISLRQIILPNGSGRHTADVRIAHVPEQKEVPQPTAPTTPVAPLPMSPGVIEVEFTEARVGSRIPQAERVQTPCPDHFRRGRSFCLKIGCANSATNQVRVRDTKSRDAARVGRLPFPMSFSRLQSESSVRRRPYIFHPPPYAPYHPSRVLYEQTVL
jgi:Aldo/keto reductase family